MLTQNIERIDSNEWTRWLKRLSELTRNVGTSDSKVWLRRLKALGSSVYGFGKDWVSYVQLTYILFSDYVSLYEIVMAGVSVHQIKQSLLSSPLQNTFGKDWVSYGQFTYILIFSDYVSLYQILCVSIHQIKQSLLRTPLQNTLLLDNLGLQSNIRELKHFTTYRRAFGKV